MTNEVVELAARWPVDINKRTNAGICGQLCYYCTPAKYLQVTSILKLEKKKRKQQQRTTDYITSTWRFIVSIDSSDNSGMVKLKSYLTSSPKLKQFDFFHPKTPQSGKSVWIR